MPKSLQVHPAERMDLSDFTRGSSTYTKESVAQVLSSEILDNQARYLRGFRVEIPDQNTYPGRIVVHGGTCYGPDGVRLFNEDQSTVSRTVTLEAINTNFYVEIEFSEGDGEVDSRAFWDPTVEQGTDTSGDNLPDGQEFNSSVATVKVPDWKIVTPISNSAFARDADPSSTRIPLVLLRTDGANKINTTGNTALTTAAPATTLLEVASTSTTLLRVIDAQLFLTNNYLIVGEGLGTQETVNISSVDVEKGLVTLSGALSNSHYPGEICRTVTGGAVEPLDIIDESVIGRYRRDSVAAAIPDHEVDVRDKLLQGDEVHGDILSKGHASTTDRSDVNVQSLKDYVDFLSAQIQEMKWGSPNPYSVTVGDDREPPTSFTTDLRYFHKVSGIMGTRSRIVSVGDGTSSFGDLNGTTQAVIQDAHDLLPAGVGGTIHLKRGTYTLSSDLTLNNTGTVIIEGEPGTNITVSGGSVVVTGTQRHFVNVTFTGGTSTRAVSVGGTKFVLSDCTLNDCQVYVNDLAEFKWHNTLLDSSATAMATIPLIEFGSSGILGGTITSCRFVHDGAAAPANSILDATTSGLNSASYLTLKDCSFDTTGATSSSDINFGTAGCNNISFVDCSFSSDNGREHIYVDGASNFRVLRCTSSGGSAALLSMTDSSNIWMDACVVAKASAGFGAYFQNANKLKVTNNTFTTDGILSLSSKALHISVTSDSEDVVVSGNSFEGDGTNVNTSGMFITVDASSIDIEGVHVSGNIFHQLEVGIYVGQPTGTGGYLRKSSITDNVFVDKGGTSAVALTQKIPIFVDSVISLGDVSITSNDISNVNPANTNLVLGQGRYGILILTTSCYNVSVTNNRILRVGAGSNEVATAGIYVGGASRSTVSNNLLSIFYGTVTYGLALGVLDDCSVNGNSVGGLANTSGNAMSGISITEAADTVISNNEINSMFYVGATASSTQGGIYVAGGSSTNLEKCTISGNKVESNGSAIAPAISIRTHHVDGVSINGNTIGGTFYRGINIELGVASGTFRNVAISGNSIEATQDGLYLNAGSATTTNTISVSGNTIYTTVPTTLSNTYGIWVNDVDYGLVISGNSILFNDNTGCFAFGVKVDACEKFQIVHNTITRYSLGGAALIGNRYHIEIPSGCDTFIVAFNICNDENTSGAQTTIYTLSAGTNGCIVGANVLDQVGSSNSGHYPINLTSAAPSAGTTGQSITFT